MAGAPEKAERILRHHLVFHRSKDGRSSVIELVDPFGYGHGDIFVELRQYFALPGSAEGV